MTDLAGSNVTDGTGQDSRFPPALQEGYFNADERTLENLLAMSAEFASSIHFYNLHNEKEGSWSDLFAGDETVIMAQILNTDVRRLESEFVRRRGSDLKEMAAGIHRLADAIDSWFKKLNASESRSGKGLSLKIREVIEERLSADLNGLLRWTEQLKIGSREKDSAAPLEGEKGKGTHLHFSSFDEIWRIEEEKGRRTGASKRGNAGEAKRFLEACFYSFLHAVSYLKTITPSYFQETLRSQTHNPAVGLFIAFLRLFQKTQNRLNTFTQRHLDFYYHEVLKVAPRPPRPDLVYLVFEPAAGKNDIFIPKGTEFIAGKEKGAELIYAADHDLIVTDAVVQSLRTLCFERDRRISPERELNYTTGARTNRPTAETRLPGEGESDSFSLFGAEKEGGKGMDGEAEIGFAVASPLLFLKEGLRKIEITLLFAEHRWEEDLIEEMNRAGSKEAFSETFGAIFSRYLLFGPAWLTPERKRALLEKAERFSDPEIVGEMINRDRQALFYRRFNKLFTISLTAESGWHPVLDYTLKLSSLQEGGSNGLKCLLTLGPEVEPIVGYTPSVHGGRWETESPVIRFEINGKSPIYPYSIFDRLLLREVAVEVKVEGVKDLLLYNNQGRLDSSKPFQPFGPLPTSNSYLVIGNYETARKNMTALSINLEWGELPRNAGGFREYYKGYEPPFSNEIFESEMSVFRDGRWLPEERELRSKIRLFDTEKERGAVCEKKRLEVGVLRYFKSIAPAVSEETFRFDLKARNGFFRIGLAAPETAFGHYDYPTLLTRTLSASASKKWTDPIPNPPYTPLINRMSLDYTAKSIITLGAETTEDNGLFGEKIFHLHPFGMEEIYPEKKGRSHPLFPRYGYDGNLFIGLSARQISGILTLFFQMGDDSAREISSDKPEIAWFYLASNYWRRLEPSRILSDTTEGFLSSGIVTLDLPDEINRKNTLLPEALYWLRVSANGHLQAFSSLYSIRTHALQIAWRDKNSPAAPVKIDPEAKIHDVPPEKEIPARTVWKPSVSISGLGKIFQIVPSFGGRPPERPDRLKTRISERLRHKHRASIPLDYEQLILERFPDLFKVKCFPNTIVGKEGPRPGHVLIVVVPHPMEAGACKNERPKVNAVALNRIHDFVQRLSAPFVRISVRNPVYERIQVRCTVKFAEEAQRGFSINRLSRAVSAYLSPWNPEIGYQAKFGWSIRQEEIESYILGLDYVEFVTNFSMLHITEDDAGEFRSEDTAAMEGAASHQIHPKYPWSLAIPLQDHFIESIDGEKAIKAEITGVNELEIGKTLIIRPKRSHD